MKCVMCTDTLACVAYSCNHAPYCEACDRKAAEAGLRDCPKCQKNIARRSTRKIYIGH